MRNGVHGKPHAGQTRFILRHMELEFTGELWYWRGPAPWHFVTVPEAMCAELAAVSPAVSYGWGMIPATVTIGETSWYTALWPKDGRYIVPVKAAIRKTTGVDVGDQVRIGLRLA